MVLVYNALQKMLKEWQTVSTLMRMFLQNQSDLRNRSIQSCKAALKEARSMIENRSNQIQYDFYLSGTHCSPLKSLRRTHKGSKQYVDQTGSEVEE